MSDTVKAWIEERRRTREYEPTMFERADTEVAYPRALDALNAVLELHKAVFDIHDPDARAYCHECGYRPCATVQAIEGAINGD